MSGQDFRNLLNTLETVDKKLNIKEAWNKWGEFLKEAGTKKSKVDSKVFQGVRSTKDSPLQATKSGPISTDATTRTRTQNVALRKEVPAPDLAQIDRVIGKSETDDDWGDLEMNAPQLAQQNTPALGQDADAGETDMAINAPGDWDNRTTKGAETTEIEQRIHNVEWVNMLDLPGNMSQIIRNLGRRVFSAFGEQDYEFIDVLSTITHDEEDLDVVSGLVRQFGTPVQKDAIVDFQDTIPGYKAHAGVWSYGTQYYMFIKDDMGEYIYAWDNRTKQLPNADDIPGSKKDTDKPLLNDINEARNGFTGGVASDPLMDVTYKGYTYDPEVERDDDSVKLIHHITNPYGKWHGIAPDWFYSISPYSYASAEEFKRAVDEVDGD